MEVPGEVLGLELGIEVKEETVRTWTLNPEKGNKDLKTAEVQS